MEIRLEEIGKKFSTEWIFRGLTFTIPPGSVTAVLGRNGSGKSTLLQVMAGNLHPTEGLIRHTSGGTTISPDEVFRQLVIVAPYMELIEDFTLDEAIRFHFSFKPFLPGQDRNSLARLLNFPAMKGKPIRKFSSGMKQRLKLALAFLSDVPLILLDEPTMNLDSEGTGWYLDLVDRFSAGRTLVICSNLHVTESSFATFSIDIETFKPSYAGKATK